MIRPQVVNRIVGGLLRNSVHYLQPILSSPPHAISRVLDRLKIRPDHSVDFHQPTLPTPGSFVPIEDHHLLKDDFAEFTAGEYVGYELGDDETTGEPTILYATIIEQVRKRWRAANYTTVTQRTLTFYLPLLYI